jgi:hypothetical protein
LTPAEDNYYAAMKELGEFRLIVAGIGGGFLNTSELHVMKFDEAITKSNKPNWDKAVLEEHDRFSDHTAFETVNQDEVPKGTKIITPTWAMKKKASGTYLWLPWVDDCLVGGKDEGVKKAKGQMMELFDYDDVGELKEYVGCMVDYNQEAGTMKLTQSVMIQSFQDEFELSEGKLSNTPAIPGTVMSEGEERNQVNDEIQSTYRSGVGKLLHMMRWTRPEIMNSVRELSRVAGRALLSHVMAMYQVMKYCCNTPGGGLLLTPTMRWDGSPMLLFEITGYSDSDWAKDPITRRSVSGWLTFLFDSPISMKSKMMPIVALSVTAAELFAAT